jgi:hypothetical protein
MTEQDKELTRYEEQLDKELDRLLANSVSQIREEFRVIKNKNKGSAQKKMMPSASTDEGKLSL